MGNKIDYKKNKNYSTKLNLLKKVSINSHSKIKNEPICFLLTDYSEIDALSRTNKFTRFLFFNKDQVHLILYNEDKNITINNELKENDLASNFYLCLLIRVDEDVLNYIVHFNYIEKLNKQKKDGNYKFYNLIISKEVLELLKNYKNQDIDENIDKNIVSQLEKENIDYIENNIIIFHEIGLNLNAHEFIEINIAELYTNIIISLIKNDKLADFDFSIQICEQLNLENIDIPFEQNNLLKKILEALDLKKEYLQKYNIENFEDIENSEKMKFFYILLKYTFKCSLYVYKIPLLTEARQKVINFLESNNYQNYLRKQYENDENDEINDYVYQNLGDFYYEKAKSNYDKSITFYKSFYGPKENVNRQYLGENYDNNIIGKEIISKEINSEIQRIIFNLSPGKDGKIIKEKEYQNNGEKYIEGKEKLKKFNGKNTTEKKNYKLNIDDSLLKKFLDYIIELLEKKEQKCLQNFMFKIMLEEQNNQYFAYYTFIDSRPGKNSIEGNDCDIFGKDFQKLTGLNKIINQINSKKQSLDSTMNYSVLNKTSDQSINQSKNDISNITNNESKYILYGIDEDKKEKEQKINEELEKIIPKEYQDFQDFKLSKFERVLYNHNGSVKFFLHLKHGYYLSCGNSGDIVIYDEKINYKAKIPNLEDILYYITEKEEKNNNKSCINLIACCLKNIYLISIYKKNVSKYSIKKYQIPKCNTLFCYNIEKNYIISGNGLTANVIKLFDDQLEEKKMFKISEITFETGIQIDGENIAMISNALLPGGKNQISIFNIYNNKLVYEITDNICPTLTENCACIMKFKNGPKFLLVGNKKIKNSEKNGILIVNMDLKLKGIKTNFYDTNNFQIYCLCQIILKKENGADSKYVLTQFFLAGGFDLDKKIGMVKLFQLKNEKNLDIKYIQDLDIEDNNDINEEFSKKSTDKNKYEEIYDKSGENINLFDSNIKDRESTNKFEENCNKFSDNNNSSQDYYNKSLQNTIQSKDFYNKTLGKNEEGESRIKSDKEKFLGFKMPVNTITQSDNSGEIIITTIDGGVYLFSQPNLSFYMDKSE